MVAAGTGTVGPALCIPNRLRLCLLTTGIDLVIPWYSFGVEQSNAPVRNETPP